MGPVSRACSRRSLGIFAGAVGLFGSAPSVAAPSGIRPHWSFHAGAPLSGAPGVGPDGTLVFGTVDGYVHAVRADGVFRYSYTVAGRVMSQPVVFDDGVALVATDKGRLYAIQPDGSLAWWKTIAGGVASELALDPRGRV
jgi:outer membrane protein assembly factor BamB